MIRLRIERFTIDEIMNPHDDCIVWFEDGQPVGRVIIEQSKMVISEDGDSHVTEWVPVEVIDEQA